MQYLLCAAVFDAYYRCCGIHSQNLVDSAKPLLRKAIQISQQTPYWHCRLLFQLAVCIISHTFYFNFIFFSYVFVYMRVGQGRQTRHWMISSSFNIWSCYFGILFSSETEDQKSQRHWLECYFSLSATSYSGERLSVSLWPTGSWSWICPSGWLRVYKVNVSHSSSCLLWILSFQIRH